MNGLSDSVMKLYSDFDPDLKISLMEGKRFNTKEIDLNKIKHLPEIAYCIQSLEETVLLKYRDNQEVAILKGVSPDFSKMSGIEDDLVDGYFSLWKNQERTCVLGTDLALKLGVNLNLIEPIYVYVPNLEGSAIPGDFFKSIAPYPAGVFDINMDFNAKYLLVSQKSVEDLLNIKNQANSIELDLKPGSNIKKSKEKIEKIVGSKFKVKTRFEQNEFLFRSINAEKWITLLILSFIVVLAVFNVIGSLTILVIDKGKDIFILQSMGASLKTIRFIFWLEGCIISTFGSAIGLGLGILSVYLQQKFCYFGYGASDKIECFPVKIIYTDVLIIFALVNTISLLTSLVPVFRIKKALAKS